MSKYDKFQNQRSMRERPYEIHPVWRGIGCLLIIISPFIAYSLAHVLINMNLEAGWFLIPRDLAQTINIPVPGLNISVPYLYAKLMLAAVFLVFGIGLLMIVYALIYQLVGPSRYGPLDAKPVRRSPKKKKSRR
jgi:hypothetical protein